MFCDHRFFDDLFFAKFLQIETLMVMKNAHDDRRIQILELRFRVRIAL